MVRYQEWAGHVCSAMETFFDCKHSAPHSVTVKVPRESSIASTVSLVRHVFGVDIELRYL